MDLRHKKGEGENTVSRSSVPQSSDTCTECADVLMIEGRHDFGEHQAWQSNVLHYNGCPKMIVLSY